MTRAKLSLSIVLSVGFAACGGSKPILPAQSASTANDIDDVCARDGASAEKARNDHFLAYCTTTGSEPALEQRMRETITSAGIEARHFRLRCREDACRISCDALPPEQCGEELRRLGQWSAHQGLFEGIRHNNGRHVSLYKFLSREYIESLPARKTVLSSISRRFHASGALALCKDHATAHGLLLLYITVPVSGSPSVTVDGELAMSADADCVSKALLAAVLEERPSPPLTNLDLPIAVSL